MPMRNLLPEIWRRESTMSPFREMSRLQRRLDRMFSEYFNEPSLWEPATSFEEEFTPACDVEETKDHYLVSFDLPGMNRNDVKIEVQENQLTVWGERKREQKEEEKGRMSRERYYGSFMRSFTLPTNVNAEKIEANYQNGVLQIAIPKTAPSAGKQIQIKEGKLIETKEKAA